MPGDALVKVFALELPAVLCAVSNARASRLSSFCEVYFLDCPCYSLLQCRGMTRMPLAFTNDQSVFRGLYSY